MRDPFCAVSTADLGRARCAFFFFFFLGVSQIILRTRKMFLHERVGDLSPTPSVVSACSSDLPFGRPGPIPQRAPARARRELRRT